MRAPPVITGGLPWTGPWTRADGKPLIFLPVICDLPNLPNLFHRPRTQTQASRLRSQPSRPGFQFYLVLIDTTQNVVVTYLYLFSPLSTLLLLRRDGAESGLFWCTRSLALSSFEQPSSVCRVPDGVSPLVASN
ncbi:hypothetical protein F4805DRAFT_458660 [Annulohypoxylon moriforme]|nr:hypothetical protein F4805DRAFT_458660 [Annulohypoxylon moriforme]